MDITQTTHISLCAGYGGIDLGLKRAIPDLRTIAFSEIEAFACANLVAKMEAGFLDAAPIWSDLKTFPWEQFSGLVDILSGGYPCQPFSSAGKRLGAEDPRHLWPFIADGISILRPRLVFFENVEGHVSLGLRDVLRDLGGLGYRATWGIFSASEVGAPHQRKRVFILAHRSGEGLQRFRRFEQIGLPEGRQIKGGHTSKSRGFNNSAWPSRPGKEQHAWEPPRVVANANSGGGWENWEPTQSGTTRIEQSSCFERRTVGHTANKGQPERGSGTVGQPGTEPEFKRPDCGSLNTERKAEPPLGGNADGASSRLDYADLCRSCDNRTDELRLLGNGVVPATAEKAFRTLFKELTE